VDAAYGWPLVLTDEGEELRDGLARADSIALDPHKWFAQPFEAGCLLVREGRLLPETFALRPEYMQDVFPAEDEINFADHGIALTRRFRALKIWFSIKVLGLGWFRKLVSHCCRLAELAQGLLERIAEFEILNPRQLSIVCFRYVPARLRREAANRERELNQFNLLLAERLRATQRAFVSTTLLQGRVALRVCFVNWRTRAADVETIVHLLTDLGKELAT
jgi:glutamate/tyrosine decarboxylase-like PLP-dependent enzyme